MLKSEQPGINFKVGTSGNSSQAYNVYARDELETLFDRLISFIAFLPRRTAREKA